MDIPVWRRGVDFIPVTLGQRQPNLRLPNFTLSCAARLACRRACDVAGSSAAGPKPGRTSFSVKLAGHQRNYFGLLSNASTRSKFALNTARLESLFRRANSTAFA